MKLKKHTWLIVGALIASTVTALSQQQKNGEVGPRNPHSLNSAVSLPAVNEHKTNDSEKTVRDRKERPLTDLMNELQKVRNKEQKKEELNLDARQMQAGHDAFKQFIRNEEAKYIKLALNGKRPSKKMLAATIKEGIKTAKRLQISKNDQTAIEMMKNLFTDELVIRQRVTECCYEAAGYKVKANVSNFGPLVQIVLTPNPDITSEQYEKISSQIEHIIPVMQSVNDQFKYLVDNIARQSSQKRVSLSNSLSH